jgi:aspartyl-tRNA(Asn)/glutamyl-tRNA(Gln) amidotransferase subunit B
MEEGSIRCDCNVSIRPIGQSEYGERCEIKNVNSKKFAREAINYESRRQEQLINSGEKITKTTLLFNPDTGETKPMRKKETENDYRYFPEPDLAPMKLTADQINKVKDEIDWLPWSLKAKLKIMGINDSDADKICEEKNTAKYFLTLIDQINIEGKELGSLFVNKMIPDANQLNIEISTIIKGSQLKAFVDLYTSGKVSKSNALANLWPEIINNANVDVMEKAKDLNLIIEQNQDFLDDFIKQVFDENPDKVIEYKKGKKGLIGFFMGQVKLKAGNSVNPGTLKEKVEESLK